MEKDPKVQPQRAGKAALVWLMVFIVLGTLLLYKSFTPEDISSLSQTVFERKLAAGEIKTAVLTPESDRVFTVSGKFSIPAALLPKSDASVAGKVPPKAAPVVEKGDKSDKNDKSYTTRVIYSDRLSDLLAQTQVKVESGKDTWMTVLLSLLPWILILGLFYFITSRQIRNAGRGAMDFGKSKARMIPPDELKIKFEDIAGADEAKEEIQEIVEFLKDPLKFQLVGGHIPKGCLLVGPPGTGKTLLAKAVACEAGVPFFSISGSDFVEMFVGVGASRVRDMFEQARKHTPCLIFIDEIDAVGRSRFSGLGGGHDEREQTLNAMLVEMDGLESRTGVIVLAATNRPDVLDQALLRPGRFDRQVVMDLPDIEGRRKILEVHVRKIKVDASVDLNVVARTTPGFSGADLANLCNEAALLAARYNREAATQDDMEEARDKVCYGRERRSRKIIERERRLTAYHEAGHALVAIHSEYATPVHKVTIIPRGQSYLGATFMMPKEDVYTQSRLEMLATMAMAMGGRVAEELVFGDITSGASADIAHATHIARQMTCIYGMTELGPVKYADANIHPHLRLDMPPQDSLSPETAREIDIAIRRLITDAHDNATAMLKKYRSELEKLALALLERETLDIDEIAVLLDLTPEESKSVSAPATIGPQAAPPEVENADPATGDSHGL